MDKWQMQTRTKRFALRTLRLVSELQKQKNVACWAIARQLVRSGTSVGANYRAACKARSRAEFLAKLGIVEKEADGTCYWLELLVEGEFLKQELLQPLLDEANEIVSMVAAAKKSTKRKAAEKS